MLIRFGFDIEFELPAPCVVTCMLYTHPSVARALLKPDELTVEPATPVHIYWDSFGNRCGRVNAAAGRLRFTNDCLLEDTGRPDIVAPEAPQHSVAELPDDTLLYLLASRYCEVDRFSAIAWERFGGVPEGWGRVQAICDWVHSHVRFDYMQTHPSKSAWDVYQEGVGVCRDFQHLAITLCRCMNIPARYATGYLGDIGVPPSPDPMDFSAWFQVYLDGRWYDFDARNNRPRIGRILMATGRDAVDVALTTSFGVADLKRFVVWTEDVSPA
ncbi:MAG TPA: transglutaminase family protein [Chthonomonadaceae bacterium]|nr:transglutaminase family protein [Chthonomonadaceae bacterium]